MPTPYLLRRFLSFLPLLLIGIAEGWLDRDLEQRLPFLRRLDRWGTWRKP